MELLSVIISIIISTILATTFSVKITSKKVKKEVSGLINFTGNKVENLSGGSKVIDVSQK
jgi:hypothetical protein